MVGALDLVAAENVEKLSSLPRKIGKIFRQRVRVKTKNPC
jgi:hypothetical protein